MNKNVLLSTQHVLAMFGATVLVPYLTGLNVAVTLFCAGVGTLLFHIVTKGQVPVFLGSSFAFIGGILVVGEQFGMSYATGSIAVSGVVYVLASLLVFLIGIKKFLRLFPPVVISPIIIVIGLILAPIAIDMSSSNWFLAIFTMTVVLLVSMFTKGFLKLIPILIGIISGYVLAIITGNVDFTPVKEATWFSVPSFHAPEFNWVAISIIVPIAIVTLVEHIGDITTNGSVVGKNFLEKPGLHRTLLGDGLATMFSGVLGGPANTTYGENTGVLAVTKAYKPSILQGAAVIAILLSFVGKFSALIGTIPISVMGGISFILFGMIANIGVKQLIDNQVDLSKMNNSIVFFAPLILGIASITEKNPATIQITEHVSVSGLSLAAMVAIVLNVLINIIGKKFIREA